MLTPAAEMAEVIAELGESSEETIQVDWSDTFFSGRMPIRLRHGTRLAKFMLNDSIMFILVVDKTQARLYPDEIVDVGAFERIEGRSVMWRQPDSDRWEEQPNWVGWRS